MLENENILEEFKKSLTATVKSIGKSDSIEVNFVKETSSIDGDIINLQEPSINSIKNDLNYIRGEADSKALELRYHRKNLHKKFFSKNDTVNQIFNALELSRVEAKGSEIFKGIKSNIKNKHQSDLKNINQKYETENEIVNAFRYVSFSELSDEKLEGNYNEYKKIIKHKLKKKYDEFFLELKKKYF